jgi:hypothetical protein
MATTSVIPFNGTEASTPSDQWPLSDDGATRSRGRSNDLALNSDVTGFDDWLNGAPVTTPTASDRVNTLRDDLRFFDREITADREVMEGPYGGCLNNIESREVPASGASVAIGHRVTVLGELGSHSNVEWLPRRRGRTS